MPPLLPPPLPYFIHTPRHRPSGRGEPAPRIPSPESPETPRSAFWQSPPHAHSLPQHDESSPSPSLDVEHSAEDLQHSHHSSRPHPSRRGPSWSAPAASGGTETRQPVDLPAPTSPARSPPSGDAGSNLSFYRTQILANCRLLFTREEDLHIITSPKAAYVTNGSSPPRILLDSRGGLRELYYKSQEQVASMVESLQRHQDHTSTPRAEKPQWGRDPNSVVSSYMALRKEERRRKKDWEKTEARKIPGHLRYRSDTEDAVPRRKLWSSMELERQREVGREEERGIEGWNWAWRSPLERRIEMDSALPVRKVDIMEKVQRWREGVPAADVSSATETPSPPTPPPIQQQELEEGSEAIRLPLPTSFSPDLDKVSPPVIVDKPLHVGSHCIPDQERGFAADVTDDASSFELINHADVT